MSLWIFDIFMYNHAFSINGAYDTLHPTNKECLSWKPPPIHNHHSSYTAWSLITLFIYLYKDGITTLTDVDMWLAIDRQKKQEELALKEAEQKGEKKGEQKEKAAVARRMLSNGSDVEVISIATGLTPEEITKLADSSTQWHERKSLWLHFKDTLFHQFSSKKYWC